MQLNKPAINFFLHRWQLLAPLAAVERIQIKLNQYIKETSGNSIDSDILKIKPTKQINLIKDKIIKILPEVEFIRPNYESPCELNPEDFAELYINHQKLCITKVREILKRKTSK